MDGISVSTSHQNRESLDEAIRTGNCGKVHALLKRNPRCGNVWNLNFKAPLFTVYDHVDANGPAQDDDRLAIMKLLVDNGANVNVRDIDTYDSALIVAVTKRQVNGARFLLENGADPNARNMHGRTALWIAAHLGLEDIVQLLLNHKADANIESSRGNTPLDAAISAYRVRSAEKLVKAGAKSNNFYQSLLAACRNTPRVSDELRHKDFVERVLDVHGSFSPEVLVCHMEFKRHDRCHQSGEECWLESLCERVNNDNCDVRGDSGLHVAVGGGNVAKIEALLRSGANVNLKNKFGDTPLHVALRLKKRGFSAEYCKIIDLLVDYGAGLCMPNNFDETPIFLAAKRQNVKLMNLILARITRVDHKTLGRPVVGSNFAKGIHFNKNKPQYHELIVAINLGHEQIVDGLLDIIDAKERKNCGRYTNRVIHVAFMACRYSIVKMLLEAGFRSERCYPESIVQFYSSSNHNEDALKVACLLWEFNDIGSIYTGIAWAFHYIFKESTPEELVYLLTFYYVILTRLNRSIGCLDLAQGLFESMPKVLLDCNRVLDILEVLKVGDMSIYRIITMPFESFVKILNNESYLHEFTNISSKLDKKCKLQYYQCALKIRIDLAIEKKVLLDVVKEHLNDVFQSVLSKTDFQQCLPNKVMSNITDYLNARDLKRLAITMMHETSRMCLE